MSNTTGQIFVESETRFDCENFSISTVNSRDDFMKVPWKYETAVAIRSIPSTDKWVIVDTYGSYEEALKGHAQLLEQFKKKIPKEVVCLLTGEIHMCPVGEMADTADLKSAD